MGIGIERDYEQNASLHDCFNHTGDGLLCIGGDPSRLPEEVMKFCVSQYHRFGIPLPPKEVIEVGAHATFMTIDCIDPYAIFFSGIGIEVSNDWQESSYEIHDRHSNKTYPADPEWLETFKLLPGQCEASYSHYISHPGIKNLPHTVEEYVESVLDGEWMGEDAIDQIGNQAELQLRELCRNHNGSIDGGKIKSYFELSAWAAWCWLFTNEGQDFLFRNHDIFWTCGEHGECIIYEGVIIDPTCYKKANRPPQSCEMCGVDAWCVDLVMLKGGSRFICEHHLNGDAPLYEGATCGSKSCRYVECQHHPYYGQEAGLAKTLRQTGQLVRMTQSSRELLDSGPQVKQIRG